MHVATKYIAMYELVITTVYKVKINLPDDSGIILQYSEDDIICFGKACHLF